MKTTKMTVNTLVFDEARITSPTNGNNPRWNDSCHTLSKDCGRADVIIKYEENEDGN